MASVLILEDDIDCRELLGDTVTMLTPHSCVKTGTLAELEARSREVLSCSLALLDINLGTEQPSGVDAWRWLVRHGFQGRIVFLTGHAESHPLVLEAARVAGARVLTKPVETGVLVELVKELA
jgi:DNA-binding NtrC family response regulator